MIRTSVGRLIADPGMNGFILNTFQRVRTKHESNLYLTQIHFLLFLNKIHTFDKH